MKRDFSRLDDLLENFANNSVPGCTCTIMQGDEPIYEGAAGYADIASSPLDALAAMVGEKDAPKTIAQGVLDFDDLPAEGEEREITIPLERPLTGKSIGSLTLLIR